MYGFQQIIENPTRIDGDSKSLIDIIATNNNESIRETSVIPSGIADHDMIGCVRKVNFFKFETRKITCRDYRNYDPTKLKTFLLEQDWNPLFHCKDVNNAWSSTKTVNITRIR